MKLPSLLQLVVKIDNLQQVCGVLGCVYYIVKDDIPTAVTAKWKPGFSEHNLPVIST